MRTSQPSTLTKYPIGMREPRAFGVEDRPRAPPAPQRCTCPVVPRRPATMPTKCKSSPVKCNAEITRSADHEGKPHPPTGRLDQIGNACFEAYARGDE
jgi:hypothetical protein